jgi:cytochrome P450
MTTTGATTTGATTTTGRTTPTAGPRGLRHRPAAPGGPTLRGLLFDLDALPDRLERIVGHYDGVAAGRSGPVRTAVVCDPGLARELLTRPTGTGQGKGIAALRVTLGQGLLTSSGEVHKRQRRLVQPAFQPRRLTRYARDAVRAACERSATWRDGQQVDLAEQMSSLTLDVVGRTIFGADVRDDAREVSEAQNDLLACFPRLMRPAGLLAVRLPTPLRRRVRGSIARLDRVVEHVVADRRTHGDAGDMVSMLLAVRDEQTGEPMPARQVRDEVLTLLLAGHETTAVLLSWAWFELGRTPAARGLLDAELGTATAREAIAGGDWQRLPVTRAVVAETLRLHPPAYVLGRAATADLTLGGRPIRRGTVCLVSPYGLGRDVRSWGPDAASWRPQRWLGPDGGYDEAAPGQPRGAFLPFGAGSRVCIGAAFATMEATLILATLASAWRAELADGFDPGLLPRVTLRPRLGVPATLRRL